MKQAITVPHKVLRKAHGELALKWWLFITLIIAAALASQQSLYVFSAFTSFPSWGPFNETWKQDDNSKAVGRRLLASTPAWPPTNQQPAASSGRETCSPFPKGCRGAPRWPAAGAGPPRAYVQPLPPAPGPRLFCFHPILRACLVDHSPWCIFLEGMRVSEAR